MVKFILDNFDTIFRDEKSFETFDKMILDLAVRGKLVPQIEDEEPASKLLQRIREEKERLIVEKVIKKEKPLPSITEDEKPFNIPSSWEWVRLGEIFNYGGNGSIKPEAIEDNEWVLELEDIEKDTSTILQEKFNFERKSKSNKNKFTKGDILYGKLRPYLNKVLVAPKNGVSSSEIVSIRGYLKLKSEYFLIQLKSPHFSERINKLTYGTKMPRLGTDDAIKSLLTLPPLEEQERIVEKVKKLQELSKKFKEIYNSNEKIRANLKKSILEEVEKSDTNNELLISLEKLFGNFEKVIKTKEDVKDIRNLVLSLAVRGKLVPQIEDEEPASKLLQRIKGEKERLIAEKVIKKEKPLPPITEDEKPYDIPNSWELVRLGEISNILRGSSPRPKGDPKYFTDERTPYHWITIWDITNKSLNNNLIDTREFLTEEGSKKSTYCEKGEIIIAVSGSVGKSSILNINGYIYDGLAVLKKISNSFNQQYIYLFLKYFVDKINSMATGTAFPNINTEILKNIILPVPSLKEQERIVKRVDELMAICDTLESKIEIGEKINQKLLESLLK